METLKSVDQDEICQDFPVSLTTADDDTWKAVQLKSPWDSHILKKQMKNQHCICHYYTKPSYITNFHKHKLLKLNKAGKVSLICYLLLKMVRFFPPWQWSLLVLFFSCKTKWDLSTYPAGFVICKYILTCDRLLFNWKTKQYHS